MLPEGAFFNGSKKSRLGGRLGGVEGAQWAGCAEVRRPDARA